MTTKKAPPKKDPVAEKLAKIEKSLARLEKYLLGGIKKK